jgi:hypothetical protein
VNKGKGQDGGESNDETADEPEPKTPSRAYGWHEICSAIEVKKDTQAPGQVASYGMYFTQAKPEYYAMLGVSASKKGYIIFYVGGASIHHSPEIGWDDLDPLRKYIFRLYQRPFRTPLLVTYPNNNSPFTLLRTSGVVYLLSNKQAQGGRSRRRFTAILQDTQSKNYTRFLKRYYVYPASWRFPEGDLMARAHSDGYIPGLACALTFGATTISPIHDLRGDASAQ